MIGEAIRYPTRGRNWLPRVGIGGVLVLVGVFLLIPLILVEGYVYRVLGRVTRGNYIPPEWGEWVDLFIEGVQMYIVQIAYAIVPAVLLFSGAIVAGFGFFAGDGTAIAGMVLLSIGGILAVFVAYLLPAALANLAHRGYLAAGFDLRTVIGTAFTIDYFVAIVLAVAIGLVGGLLGAAFSVLIVGVFVLFYVQVVVAFIVARGFVLGGGTRRR